MFAELHFFERYTYMTHETPECQLTGRKKSRNNYSTDKNAGNLAVWQNVRTFATHKGNAYAIGK